MSNNVIRCCAILPDRTGRFDAREPRYEAPAPELALLLPRAAVAGQLAGARQKAPAVARKEGQGSVPLAPFPGGIGPAYSQYPPGSAAALLACFSGSTMAEI